MRNFTLLFFLLVFLNSSFGQITFSPDPIEVTANKSIENIQTDFELKNEGADTVFLAWTLDVVEQPGDWQYYVCDTEVCYNFNQDEGSTSRPNIIPPGESIIVMFHTLPAEVEGEGSYNVKFFDLNFPDSLKVDVPIVVNTITSSTSDLAIKGLSIFPNPTTDFFRVNAGSLVSTIDVVSVIGKKMRSFQVKQGSYYDISELNSGIYYVRLLDEQGDSVKVLKLKKN